MSAQPDRALMRAVAEVVMSEERARAAADRELTAGLEQLQERIRDELTRSELPAVPDDIAEQVAKAVAVLKESQTLAATSPTIVLNVNSAAVNKSKTITTHRDKDGNLVAEVTERD